MGAARQQGDRLGTAKGSAVLEGHVHGGKVIAGDARRRSLAGAADRVGDDGRRRVLAAERDAGQTDGEILRVGSRLDIDANGRRPRRDRADGRLNRRELTAAVGRHREHLAAGRRARCRGGTRIRSPGIRRRRRAPAGPARGARRPAPAPARPGGTARCASVGRRAAAGRAAAPARRAASASSRRHHSTRYCRSTSRLGSTHWYRGHRSSRCRWRHDCRSPSTRGSRWRRCLRSTRRSPRTRSPSRLRCRRPRAPAPPRWRRFAQGIDSPSWTQKCDSTSGWELTEIEVDSRPRAHTKRSGDRLARRPALRHRREAHRDDATPHTPAQDGSAIGDVAATRRGRGQSQTPGRSRSGPTRTSSGSEEPSAAWQARSEKYHVWSVNLT